MALISKGFQDFGKGKVPTFMDSGASDTMFILRDAFTEYQSVAPRIGDSAKAIDGGFEIVGEGTAFQQYQVVMGGHMILLTHVPFMCQHWMPTWYLWVLLTKQDLPPHSEMGKGLFSEWMGLLYLLERMLMECTFWKRLVTWTYQIHLLLWDHCCKGNCAGASRGSKVQIYYKSTNKRYSPSRGSKEERMWIPARLRSYKPKYGDSGNNK